MDVCNSSWHSGRNHPEVPRGSHNRMTSGYCRHFHHTFCRSCFHSRSSSVSHSFLCRSICHALLRTEDIGYHCNIGSDQGRIFCYHIWEQWCLCDRNWWTSHMPSSHSISHIYHRDECRSCSGSKCRSKDCMFS